MTELIDEMKVLGLKELETMAKTVLDGEDVMAHFIGVRPDGSISFYATPWSNDLEKDMATAFVKTKLREEGAICAMLFSDTWYFALDKDNPKHDQIFEEVKSGRKRVSDYPEFRREALMCSIETRDRELRITREITRDPTYVHAPEIADISDARSSGRMSKLLG